mgnify:CR=1 FL=1
MIVAAIEPNIASPSSGIIPRMVVSEAIITGRRRLWALTTSPAMRSVSPLHCWQMSFNWVPIVFRKSLSFTINVKASMLKDLKYDRNSSFYDNFYDN